MSCSNSPFYLPPPPDFLQWGIFPGLYPEAHYPALPRERVNNIMQEAWHKASPNNRTPFFSLTPSFTPSPTSSPWASLFPSSSDPSSCNLVLHRELFFPPILWSFREVSWVSLVEESTLCSFLSFSNLSAFLIELPWFFYDPDELILDLSSSCPAAFFSCSLCLLADGKNVLGCLFSSGWTGELIYVCTHLIWPCDRQWA